MRILLATANPSRVLVSFSCSLFRLFNTVGPRTALCNTNLKLEGSDPRSGFCSYISGCFKPFIVVIRSSAFRIQNSLVCAGVGPGNRGIDSNFFSFSFNLYPINFSDCC